MRAAPVQTTRLGLQAIRDGVVQLADAEYRAVLEVHGTSSPLEDEVHAEAVLAGFARLLNGLNYPIQILVRASPVDLTGYIASLEELASRGLPGALGPLAQDHAAFILSLARQRTLLERHCYVIVPAEAAARGGWGRHWPGRRARNATDDAQLDAVRRQLTFRCDDLARQLQRCELVARRLGDIELAELFLGAWSPERSRVQRLRQRLDDYATLAVRAERSSAQHRGQA